MSGGIMGGLAHTLVEDHAGRVLLQLCGYRTGRVMLLGVTSFFSFFFLRFFFWFEGALCADDFVGF